MPRLAHGVDDNGRLATRAAQARPSVLGRVAGQWLPRYLWIGCSGSREPECEIIGTMPGELFVHRNFAGFVARSAFNGLSVLQYAVDILLVEHVIVCGHCACGVIATPRHAAPRHLVELGLRRIQRIRERHFPEGDTPAHEAMPACRLCELNTLNQARTLWQTSVIQDASKRGQDIAVHAWLYRFGNDVLQDLRFRVDHREHS